MSAARRGMLLTPEEVAAAQIAFGAKLNDARIEAGEPSYRELRRRGFSYSPPTITRALNGTTFPKWPFVNEFLTLCGVAPVVIEGRWKVDWTRLNRLIKPHKKQLMVQENLEQNTDTAVDNYHAAAPRGSECPTCFAWVTNPEGHTEWHNSQPTSTRRTRWLRPVRGPADQLDPPRAQNS